MTAFRPFLASVLLAPLAMVSDPVVSRAETIADERTPSSARDGTGRPLELAQLIGVERNRKEKNKGKEGKPEGGPPPSGDKAEGKPRRGKDAQKSKPEAYRKNEPRQQQPEGQVQPQKRDGEPARRKGHDAKRREFQQKKDNARKEEQLKARQAEEDALKAKTDAEAARQKAIQDKRDADAVRLKALKDKADAETARRKALDDRKDKVERPGDARGGTRRSGPFDRAKADQEFERARKEAQRKGGGQRDEKFEANKATRFETFRRERKVREAGSRDIIIEPDKRVIVRDDKRLFIRHDDGERFRRKNKEIRRERRKDGTWLVVTAGLAGAMIYSILDDNDRALRRSRRDADGREYVLFDDRRSYGGHYGPEHYSYIDLPPPVVRMPRDRYIVEYDRASPDDLFETLNAPPIEALGRGYTLDEVRQNYRILERMRRVDLNEINFEFASWDVAPEEYRKLDRIAHAMQRVLDHSPGELFLIEGHTDAVGSEIDNLSLSDRRAEAIAIILTDEFGIPPENLTTQGYGEEHLKEPTEGPSWVNRRVGVRRITPLLARDGWTEPD